MRPSFTRFSLLSRLGTLLAFLFVALAAQAQVTSGALTASSPTFNRPIQGTPPTVLSGGGVGTNVYYQVIGVTVATPGTYSFQASSGFDSYGFLYSPAGFNPAAPLTNAITGNDDFSDLNFRVTSNLAAGTYSLVVTSFKNGETGPFTVTTTGPAPATLATEPISGARCVGSNLNVPFTATGTYNAGNVFTAQLSDAAGSFAAPTAIGTLAGTGSGTIAATIPGSTPAGTGYRIRVVSSDPAVTGTDNGSDLTLNALPTAGLTTSLATIYLGYGPQSATLTASGGTSYAFAADQTPSYLSSGTGATREFLPQTAGTYTFTATATNDAGCSAAASVTVTVVEARCGTKNDKVLVCHNGLGLCIAAAAVPAHLAHGDQLGSCPTGAARSAASPGTGTNELALYPNPAADHAGVTFRAAANGTAQVQLFNQLGGRVATLYDGQVSSGQFYELSLDSHALAPGIYRCRLVVNGKAETKPLTIAR